MFYRGEIPFVRLLIPFVSGIFLAAYSGYYLELKTLTVGMLVLFLVLTVINLLYRQRNLYRYNFLFSTFIFLFVAVSGYVFAINKSGKQDHLHFSRHHSDALVVKVINEPKTTDDIVRFETEVSQLLANKQFKTVNGKLLLALKIDTSKNQVINYGDVFLIPPVYHEVEPPYNPAEFNFKKFLANRQIYHQAFINQQQLGFLERDKGNPVIAYALSLRKKLITRFYHYLPDADAAALASTLILGYRADLSKEVIDSYSKTGTMHVLSVSGMHVGIVFLILTMLFKPFRHLKYSNIISTLSIVSLIWFYALITGFSPSVNRAAVMLTFFVLGKAFKRHSNSYNIIAFSAFVLLLYNPYYIFDVGFQLSYLAVLGLIFFHPRIYNLLHIDNYVLDKMWSYIALSLAAQLATFPLSIYYFHQFPVYFLVSNLLIVLPVTLIMYGGIIFLIFQFELLSTMLGKALSWLISVTNDGLRYIEELPYSSLNGIWINSQQYILIYMLIGFAIWSVVSKRKIFVFASLTCLLVFVSVSVSRFIIQNDIKSLTFFSLRKNTAFAYVSNDTAFVQTDLKQVDKTTSFSVQPFLDSVGTTRQLFLSTDTLYRATSFFANDNFIGAGGFRLMRWTKAMDRIQHKRKIQVDAVLLSFNPKVSVSEIKKAVDFDLLLIDGTNPDYRIKQWQTEAKVLNTSTHILKKNHAYTIQL